MRIGSCCGVVAIAVSRCSRQSRKTAGHFLDSHRPAKPTRSASLPLPRQNILVDRSGGIHENARRPGDQHRRLHMTAGATFLILPPRSIARSPSIPTWQALKRVPAPRPGAPARPDFPACCKRLSRSRSGTRPRRRSGAAARSRQRAGADGDVALSDEVLRTTGAFVGGATALAPLAPRNRTTGTGGHLGAPSEPAKALTPWRRRPPAIAEASAAAAVRRPSAERSRRARRDTRPLPRPTAARHPSPWTGAAPRAPVAPSARSARRR